MQIVEKVAHLLYYLTTLISRQDLASWKAVNVKAYCESDDLSFQPRQWNFNSKNIFLVSSVS